MATLKDIAKKAGVTPTTVSRVINNRGYISEETKQKVELVMKDMNYQPNELARSLTKQRTNTIGVIVPHISHPFFSELISCIEEEAAEKGFKIILCNSKDMKEKEKVYLDMFVSNRVSGIILCSKYIKGEKFNTLNIPVVNFEREEGESLILIQCDNYRGGKIAAEHLIECGCENLLHFGGVRGKEMPADKRSLGFSDVCMGNCKKFKIILSDQLAFGSMNYHDFIKQSLVENPGVDGIFASSDLIAAQVIQVCGEMGLSVPKDIKLVGFDDVLISRIATPSITTIHQPIKEMTSLCIDYIANSIKGKVVPAKIILPVSLVKRASTGT